MKQGHNINQPSIAVYMPPTSRVARKPAPAAAATQMPKTL